MVKSFGWGGEVVGRPCDFSVSPSPFGLDFGTLDFGLTTTTVSKSHNSTRVIFWKHPHKMTCQKFSPSIVHLIMPDKNKNPEITLFCFSPTFKVELRRTANGPSSCTPLLHVFQSCLQLSLTFTLDHNSHLLRQKEGFFLKYRHRYIDTFNK